MLYRKAPRSVQLDADEVYRADRARLAILLHCTPAEIDRMPARDVFDLMAVLEDNAERERVKWQRK